jgi:hypothetical protein
MEPYNVFDVTRVNELTAIKTGTFNPSYQLVDGAYCYGKLYFKGWFGRTGFIETANRSWIFKQQKWYCSNVLLTDSAGNIVAVTKTTGWKRKVTLEFTNGNRLQYNCNGIFSTMNSWYSDTYGNLVNLKARAFSAKKPFLISFEPGITKANIDPILLAFMAISITLIRNEQVAVGVY